MEYTEYRFKLEPYDESFSDVLASELGDAGFDSFDTEGDQLKGYIQTALIDEKTIDAVIRNFPIDGVHITYTSETVSSSDWNSVWESGFQSIRIGDLVYIHDEKLEAAGDVKYDIRLHPRMAFGSGSHSTTRLMLQLLLTSADDDSAVESVDLTGQHVLDVGCGTGILGIAALKGGCTHLTALDIDIDSVLNTRENLILNNIEPQEVLESDLSKLDTSLQYDIILSNIHLNIHLSQMQLYQEHLKPGGQLLLSGFFTKESTQLVSLAEESGMHLSREISEEGWCAIELKKQD